MIALVLVTPEILIGMVVMQRKWHDGSVAGSS